LVDYDRAIKINPTFANIYYNRGLLKHDRLNDLAGATADLQQAAKLFKKQGNTKFYQAAIAILKSWQ
jgi:tetratricopeptide (TPR) repeat protein